MTASAPTMRSPRPASTAHQSPSPRPPSPLNPTPSSFPSFPATGRTDIRNSPNNEMFDTLSPLRERLDSGSTISPRASPNFTRPRASSFSRSPEPSPATSTLPLQQHRAYGHHSSMSGSPFAQGIPFPSSSSLSLSPPAGQLHSPMAQNQSPLSPSNSSRPGSPTSIHSFQTLLLRSPTHTTPSHVYHSQGSPIQIISPSRYVRTQSLIQHSAANPYAGQAASLADKARGRRVSLGSEIRPHQLKCGSPMLVGHSPVRDMSTAIKGESTPLNGAPICWWGGRSGWVDDWDTVAPQPHGEHDPYVAPFSGQLDGTMGMEFVRPGDESPSVIREPPGHDGDGPSAFLDEEIRASFDSLQDIDAGFAKPFSPALVHAPIGANTSYRMDGIPISQAVPIPMASGAAKSRMCEDYPGYSEVEVGSPPVRKGFAMRNMPETHRHSCHVHSHGNNDGTPDGPVLHGYELRHGGRSRRLSDASTHSSTSYASCLSGPSQSHSQSLLVSPSPSHTSACPSLSSLGIGIEEAEREELRSRSIWRRRCSGSAMKRQNKALSNIIGGHKGDGQGSRCPQLVHRDGPERVHVSDVGKAGMVPANADSKQLVTQTQARDATKHGSMFFRVSSRQGGILDEQAQREGYKTAEKYVSLAVTSILPAATITHLSPFGEALIKARDSARYVGHELAPLLRDTISVSAEVLALVPLPGLEEAAKALLCVWDACQKVDTNRLSCLRLAERCATLLYSVRCEINEAGVETAVGLAEPVEKLGGALAQIRTFLETQLHRPFLKRYVRREEIARELQACNEAITDAGSRFSISVQVRTYQEVLSMMKESKRWFAHETHALISLDHQMMQRHYAMTCGSQRQRQEVVGFSDGNALGLAPNGRNEVLGQGRNGDDGRLSPLLACGSSSSFMKGLMPTGSGAITGPMVASSILSIGHSSDGTDSVVPATPTPTRATFVVEKTKAKAIVTATPTHPTSPMQALAQVHRAQDAIDTATDEASLRGTLAGALGAQNDVEMVRCLQVARGEISEAAETLQRMLDTAEDDDGNKRIVWGDGEYGVDKGHTELDRKFIQSGIEAMRRLNGVVAKQPGGKGVREPEGIVAVAAQELPSWTITRYEVIRTRKIGMGFFSDVYLGHWRKLEVVVKVLSHSISREAFVRHVELWSKLDHPNVLPLYGASSAVGEKPWFFVSKFCSVGNLVEFLRRKRATTAGNEALMDLVKRMWEIAKGMTYLHGCGVLHGDLRAANVLVDGDGKCVLSDFGQCEIKSEAHQSCGQTAQRPIRWRAPEVLIDNDQQTCAGDIYAFAVCCVEILGMGDAPWEPLDEKAICELVLDKDERPLIPVSTGNAEAASAVTSLIQSCWVREPDHRPTFASVASSLDVIWRPHESDSPRISHPLTPVANARSASVTPTESSPGEEQYETASESMMTEVEEHVDSMIDVPLTSPVPVLELAEMVRSVTHADADDHTKVTKMSVQGSSGVLECRGADTPATFLKSTAGADMVWEASYRLIMGSSHSFHSSLTLPLWSPTRVELGAVGYLSKPKGEFVTLFNAMDPLQSDEERLRRLPSMYGYGKFEVHKREDGKRNVAQRGLDAISGFLTFKTRNDRSHPERIARQYAFPLVQGKPSANLCVEKTVHRYLDRLEAPKMWFNQHVDLILEVLSPLHAIQKEDLILVVGTLDAPDWAVFVSDDHSDGRLQFNVFLGREKGEPWGMYTVEQAVKSVGNGPARWMDVSHGTFASKVSCVTLSGHDPVGDTVIVAGLHFEREEQTPTVM